MSARLIEVLGRERLRVYPLVVLGTAAVAWIGWLALGSARVDPSGRALGADFVAFWASGSLVWDGRAAAVYDQNALEAAILAAAPVANPHLPVHYPPPALLWFALPAALPYELGLAAWSLLTIGAVAVALRALRCGPLGWRWGFAFPGILLTLFNGQTSGLVLGLFGGGLGLLSETGEARRDLLGGGVLGGLVFKPNYLAPVVVALLAARRWFALAGVVLGAGAWCGIATALLGIDTWAAWIRHMGMIPELLASDALPLAKMVTVFASLRLVGVAAEVARIVQAVVALLAVAAVAKAWTGRDVEARRGTLAVAMLLVTPFAFDYDMAVLVVALLALARRGLGSSFGWLLLAAGWAAPLAVPGLAHLGVPVVPLVLLALLVALIRSSGPSRVVPEGAGRT